MSEALIWFDGGCAPKNPGHAAFAVVVKQKGSKPRVISRYLGIRTNNYAEYTGLIVAVKYAKQLGFADIKLHSDSQLVVKQVNGEWKIKTEAMKPLNREARSILDKHFAGHWSLIWIPREKNALADHYCTLALNHGRNLNPWRKKKLPAKILDPFSSASDSSALR
jgi:ribonuclease HI